MTSPIKHPNHLPSPLPSPSPSPLPSMPRPTPSSPSQSRAQLHIQTQGQGQGQSQGHRSAYSVFDDDHKHYSSSPPPPAAAAAAAANISNHSQSLLRSFLASRAGTASPTPRSTHLRSKSHQLQTQTQIQRDAPARPQNGNEGCMEKGNGNEKDSKVEDSATRMLSPNSTPSPAHATANAADVDSRDVSGNVHRGREEERSHERRGRSKSVISLNVFSHRRDNKSPEKAAEGGGGGGGEDKDKEKRSRHQSRRRRYTIRSSKTDLDSANAAQQPDQQPEQPHSPVKSKSVSPKKMKKKSSSNLSNMFRLSTSRVKLVGDTDCPPSPTKSERGGKQKSIPTVDTTTPTGEPQQPLSWSAIFNRPVSQSPAQMDGPGETYMDDSHGNGQPQPAGMTSSRPSSPSKQHRKSDYLTGKSVLGLLRGTHTKTDGDDRDESREDNDEESSPTKKKGSNVAALISVFNQRAGSAQSTQQPQQQQQQQPQQPQAHSHSHSQSLSQPGSQPNSQSSRSNQPQSTNKPLKPTKSWTQQDLDAAFEDLLEARNIPQNMREKMRSLGVNIKTDFIQKHQHSDDLLARSTAAGGASTTTLTGPTTTATGSEKSSRSRRLGKKGKHASRSREDISDGKEKDHRERDRDKDDKDKSHDGTKSRRSRLRSRTFSRDSMRRPRSGSKPKRPKSIDFARPASVRSFGSNKSGHTSCNGSMNEGDGEGTAVGPEQPDDTFDPADFVHYLREVQKPEIVKVAKLHKLRLLLRNETVSWVDSFIWEGGMDEVIELIYRILAVEWREEHEDALLHELLLCLKALSTTSVGLAHLEDVEDKLFPTLLRMLFDEERKGPAEFTTRGLVTSLLFTHLSAPPAEERAKRSDKILSFLRDPTAPKEEQPPTFIQNMHITRPYKIWCREVTNTSREVFWIFLHHMNIIPLPKPIPKKPTTSHLNLAEFNSEVDLTKDSFYDEDEEESEVKYIYEYKDHDQNSTTNLHQQPGNQNRVYYHSYEEEEDEVPFCIKFYPPPREPVPLAPYVGGVEWDATNYIASHLDLLNALIATQPTLDKRNALRYDLQVSGFEKVMGQYLRTCKEKFYVAVHDALRLWVAAAVEDDWEVEQVRRGPRGEEVSSIGNVGVASVVRVGPPAPPGGGGGGGGRGRRKKEDERDGPPRVDIGPPTPSLGMDIGNIGG